MDLTSELRELDNKLFEYKGSETNANLYLSARPQLRDQVLIHIIMTTM